MTQENKNLLLKDLCARLPYGVKVSIVAHNIDYEEDFGKTIIAQLTGIHTVKDDDDITHPCFVTCYDKYKTQGNDIETIKPYLRSMSSMTEEEENEYNIAIDKDIAPERIVDWYYTHHLDVHGLIPMGLALEAPEGMYKTK